MNLCGRMLVSARPWAESQLDETIQVRAPDLPVFAVEARSAPFTVRRVER